MDYVDFGSLLLYLFENCFYPRRLISYRKIDSFLRKQKIRKWSDPVEVKKVLVDIGFAEWTRHGGVDCLKFSRKGIEYARDLIKERQECSGTT